LFALRRDAEAAVAGLAACPAGQPWQMGGKPGNGSMTAKLAVLAANAVRNWDLARRSTREQDAGRPWRDWALG